MNLQLHHVVADITGATGLRIIRTILAGERDPKVLALAAARVLDVERRRMGSAAGVL
jgi:plasmid stability protein